MYLLFCSKNTFVFFVLFYRLSADEMFFINVNKGLDKGCDIFLQMLKKSLLDML